MQERLPIWIAVGGTPQSVIRAAKLGLPMALAIIGGEPEQFAPVLDLYRDSARQAGHDASALPVSINSHVFVGDDSQKTADLFFPAYAEVMTRIGRERGWAPLTRAQFEAGADVAGRARRRESRAGGREDSLSTRVLPAHAVYRAGIGRDTAQGDDAPHRAARHRGGAGR